MGNVEQVCPIALYPSVFLPCTLFTMSSLFLQLAFCFVAVFLLHCHASAPPFCNGLDCPRYNVTYSNATMNLEIRVYEPVKWVRTNITGVANYSDASEDGFYKLFKYISGANANNTHVPMAAPVLTEIIPAPDSDIPVFQVSFFVPFEFQDDPPAPSDSSVFVVEDPKTTRAVYQFGGFATKWSEITEPMKALHEILADYGQYNYNSNLSYVAQYDSPYHIFNRHNEIWINVY